MDALTPPQTASAWLAHLETRFRHQPVQLGLTRVKRVAAILKVAHFDSPVILIAGTNGKGSTVTALEALYLQAGYRVGSYYSPHVLQFNERIRLNGHDVSDADLCSAFKAVAAAEVADPSAVTIDHAPPSHDLLTYFEFVTLAAYWLFKQWQPQVLIIEVGLGGRLDATNLLDADVAIITTVDFDHEAYLGETLEAIGYEKAGILRPKQAFIFGSSDMPASVRQVAEIQGSIPYYFQEHYQVRVAPDHCVFMHADLRESFPLPQIPLQAAGAAWMTAHVLRERLPVTAAARQAVATAKVLGRLQWIGEHMIVDVAHNPQSVRYLAAWLQRYLATSPKPYRVRAVFSALADKNMAAMVEIMRPWVETWHVAPLNADRAATLLQLQAAFAPLPPHSILWYNDIFSAFTEAVACRQVHEMVLVFGSFLTVAAVLQGGKHETYPG